MISAEHYKIKKAPTCPYCNQKMTKTIPPPYSIGEGFGWGVSYLWICFNDDCSLFVKGWEHMMENYGKVASYRFMCLPDNGMTETIAVFSRDGLRGGIVEEEEEDGGEEQE